MTLLRPGATTFWALAIFAGCSDDAHVVETETTSDQTDADADTSTDGGGISASTGRVESDASGREASSSDGDESSSDTGGREVESIELVVRGRDEANVYGLFRYEWVDGVASGLVPLVDDGDAGWQRAVFFADRRVVLAAQTRIMFGSLDDEPSEMVRLDVAPVSSGPFTRTSAIADEEAVVFASAAERTAYRVDLAGGLPDPPVAVAHDMSPVDILPNGVVDPLGRYFLFDIDTGEANVALAELDPPDEDAPIMLTTTVAPMVAHYTGFLPDGSGLVYQEFEQSVGAPDESRAIYFVGLDGTSVAGPTLIEELSGSQAEIAYWVAHPLGLGFVYTAGPSYGARHLSFSSVADGVATEAVSIWDDAWWFDVPSWSADGQFLTFAACDGVGGCERVLVRFVDGQPGLVTSVTPFDVGDGNVEAAVFSADSTYLYFEHEQAGVREMIRVALGSHGWYDWQVVGPHAPGDEPDRLEDLSSDGRSLLYSSRIAGEFTLLAVDVSGAEPGAPVPVSEPPVDGWIWSGRFAADGRFVLYERTTDVWDPDHLMLVHMDAPGEAFEIIPDVGAWQVVPKR